MNNGRRSCDEARGAEENVKAARLTKRGKNIWQDKKKNEPWRAFKEDDT